VKRLGVVVHHFAAEKNLKVAQHVEDQKSKQDQTGDRHDRLLANRGVVESRNRNRTHKLPLSPLCKRNIVSKKDAAQSGQVHLTWDMGRLTFDS
jgi:hypothetical protein